MTASVTVGADIDLLEEGLVQQPLPQIVGIMIRGMACAGEVQGDVEQFGGRNGRPPTAARRA